MTTTAFNKILDNPNTITSSLTNKIEEVIESYPYFQTAHILHLKGLQKQDSFKFNTHLKKTAAYCTDRAILFDFIVSSKAESPLETTENNILNKTPLHKESQATKEVLKTAQKTLSVGKPLTFSKEEKHSFNEWLQLESFKPIERNLTSEKEDLIDKFIQSNPKIQPVKSIPKSTEVTSSVEENPTIMTETLAQVYIEQKKYEKALQAYKILSLKYPEKSGFFADRIKAIKILQKNK